eukprot:TRINITY_DN1327_c0_g1_i1.p1 TRINITY_DN1327_c0_g1~~TRINITY_DN1327_c0_g1_i1.p1  ORF type:complete len:203 (-),score=48.00 TRINITY_DN1327_c0_g1_i1:333-941(-)
MVVLKIRFEEGSYEGECGDTKIPNGEGTFEFRGDDSNGRLIYEGCWKNKAADGYGKMKWINGDRYEGEWLNGLREGKGAYFSKASGCSYDGQYKNDLKEGTGKYVFSNGDYYDGQWKAGLRNGKGLYVWKEQNEKYEGDWIKGLKEGTGKFTYPNGDVFTGPYVNGNRHGKGELVKKDGEIRSENYKEGKLVSFNVIQEKSA